jgi:uncharacterized LabA/DUF88 family protein
MSGDTYLFIDGEYLRQRHRAAMQEFFGEDGHLDVEPILHQAEARRAYFYDSVDATRRPDETDFDCQNRVLERESFLSYVQSLSGFHVRRGTVTLGKKREQKEVDVQLTVDMLTHGFNGTMGKAVLLAGDRDFRPVVDALVRHGVFVDVWYHRNSFSKELPGAADFGHELRLRQLYSWNMHPFKETHHIPSEYEHAGAPYGDLVKVGSVAGSPIELRSHQLNPTGHTFSLWITVALGDTLRIVDENEKLIERYVAAQHAPIEWAEIGDSGTSSDIHQSGAQ